MSRYMERAENLARLVQVNTELLLDAETVGASSEHHYWSPVLVATATHELFRKNYPNPASGDVTYFLTLDEKNPGSIISCIRLGRENARTVRDQVSDEMWNALNELFIYVGSAEAAAQVEQSPQSFCEKIIASSLLFDGITAATLPRSEGAHFLRLGRFLERADKTSRFLDINSNAVVDGENEAIDSIHWASILRSCSAFATCRRLFGGEMNTERVIELLIFSTEFPRSVRFCVREADEALHAISGTSLGMYSNSAEKLMGQLLAKLNFSGVSDALNRGLHDFIDDLQVALNAVGQSIFENYVLLPQANRVAVRHPTHAHDLTFRLEDEHAQQQQQQ
jgi:uncharacterized alpha-E superfamily protein